jgi:hypothetical protein
MRYSAIRSNATRAVDGSLNGEIQQSGLIAALKLAQ